MTDKRRDLRRDLRLVKGGLSQEHRVRLALYPEPRQHVENVVPIRPRPAPVDPPTRPAA